MRNMFSKTLFECASENPEIYIVVADISPAGPMMDFQTNHPERFINVGVAEQTMIGMCAGLALKGASLSPILLLPSRFIGHSRWCVMI